MILNIFRLFLFLILFLHPFLFLLFLFFRYSDWPSTGLASSQKNARKASLRWILCSEFFTPISEHFCAYFRLHWAHFYGSSSRFLFWQLRNCSFSVEFTFLLAALSTGAALAYSGCAGSFSTNNLTRHCNIEVKRDYYQYVVHDIFKEVNVSFLYLRDEFWI